MPSPEEKTKPLKSLEEKNHELLLEIRALLKHMRWIQAVRLIFFILCVVVPTILAIVYVPKMLDRYAKELSSSISTTQNQNPLDFLQQFLDNANASKQSPEQPL